MKKISFVLLISLTAFFFSCSSDEKKNDGMTFTNDLDQMIGWGEHHTIIKGNAHSGKYMTFVDTTMQYSFAFDLSFDQLPNKSVKKLNASVWGKWMTGEVTLVACIVSNGKSIAWNGLKFNQVTPNPDEWAKIEVPLDIPASVPTDSKINVYMWSQNKGIGFCDDFEITFE
jgi:hypothetical protein